MTTATQNKAHEQLTTQGWLIEVFFTYLQSDAFLKKEPELQRSILSVMWQALA